MERHRMPTARHLLALALYATASLAQAGLPDSLSGAWYNPAQSGHGISVEFVGSSRAIVIWHVYNTEGRPLTLYLDGQVSGRVISGPVYAPEGMRFGEFNPATVSLPVWGTASVEFSGCTEAALAWNSFDTDYGSGRMPLVPQVPGSDPCGLPPSNPLLAQLVSGRSDAASGGAAIFFQGLVDGEGRLWGIERSRGNGEESTIPGPAWLRSTWPSVLRVSPTQVNGTTISVEGASLGAFAFAGQRMLSHDRLTGHWQSSGAASRLDLTGMPPSAALTQTWTLEPAAGVTQVLPVRTSDLAGMWTVRLQSQFFALDYSLTVGADGRVCLALGEIPCAFSGRVETPDAVLGIVDFELVDTTRPHLLPYRGRGWLADTASGRELVLVGDNGSIGLGLIARPR
jgi:hypothetical protein